MKQRQIQIPEQLFIQLCLYFLFDKTDAAQVETITAGLEAKMDKIQARTDYMEQLRKRKRQ